MCKQYNDSFVAFLTSGAYQNGKPGNVAIDANGNPVSVNNGFFDRCSPIGAETFCDAISKSLQANGYPPPACAAGAGDLQGPGFDWPGNWCYTDDVTSGGGMTGWLTAQGPVVPSETISLELMIWDTGDWSNDSSVLLDHFRWVADPTAAETNRPPN